MALAGPEPDEMAGQERIAAVFEEDVAGAAQDEVDFERGVGVPVAQVPALVGERSDDAGEAGPGKEWGREVVHRRK